VTVCLTMIVKDEAPVIARCLESVLPVIDRYTIVDTGSSDDTMAVARSLLCGLPGEVVARPWRDFAYNRTEALGLARGQGCDYLLVMDADHVWHGALAADALTADAYYVEHRYAGTHYGLACLMKASLPWRYVGAVHEFLTATVAHEIVDLRGPWVEVFHDGARSRRGDAITYDEDAQLLRGALARDPTDSRSAFYLAQSLKDAGRLTDAYAAYKSRSMMAGWDEETWYAKLEMARLAERTGMPPETVQRHYLAAYNARPTRAEPLVDLARWHRLNGEFSLAALFAQAAVMIPRPDDRLFVDAATYDWRALDELAVAGWYTPDRQWGGWAARTLQADRKYPPEQATRIESNIAFYA